MGFISTTFSCFGMSRNKLQLFYQPLQDNPSCGQCEDGYNPKITSSKVTHLKFMAHCLAWNLKVSNAM